MKTTKLLKIGLVLATTLAFLGCANTQLCRNWDVKDTVVLATAEILTFIDYRQTVEISKHPDRYFEKYSWYLSEHPSRGEVNTYFLTSAASKALIACLLPPNERAWLGLGRETWLSFNIGISSGLVHNNFSIGIGVNL